MSQLTCTVSHHSSAIFIWWFLRYLRQKESVLVLYLTKLLMWQLFEANASMCCHITIALSIKMNTLYIPLGQIFFTASVNVEFTHWLYHRYTCPWVRGPLKGLLPLEVLTLGGSGYNCWLAGVVCPSCFLLLTTQVVLPRMPLRGRCFWLCSTPPPKLDSLSHPTSPCSSCFCVLLSHSCAILWLPRGPLWS